MASYDLITAIKYRGGNAYVRKNDQFIDAIGIRSNYDVAVSRQSLALGVAANLTAIASTALVSADAYKQSAAYAASNFDKVNYALLTSSSNLASLSTEYASTLANKTMAMQQASMARVQMSKANQILTTAEASNAVAEATLINSQSVSSKIDANVKAAQIEVTNATVVANAAKTKADTDAQNATNAANTLANTPQYTYRNMQSWGGLYTVRSINYNYYNVLNNANDAKTAANDSAQAAVEANAALVAANIKLQAIQAEAAIAAKELAAAQITSKSTAANLFAAQALRKVTNIDVSNKIDAENEAATRANIIKSAIDSTTTINNNAIAMVPLAMASVSNANNAYLQRQQNALVVNGIASVARVASGNADVIGLGSLL